MILRGAFEQFLEGSTFARRTRESYTEDLAPLFAACGQASIPALTVEVVQTFLAGQESLAPATYNRCLAALRSFIRWLRTQGWQIEDLLEKVERKPEGKQTPRALDAQRVESLLRQITHPRDRALFWLIYDGVCVARKPWLSTLRIFPGRIAPFSSRAKATDPAKCFSRVPSAHCWTSI